MFLGWIRLFFFAAVGLSAVYLLLSVYMRSVERERLEKRWQRESERESDGSGTAGGRDAYVAQGIAAYQKGLKPRLLWLVFILPMIAFHVIFIYVNWS